MKSVLPSERPWLPLTGIFLSLATLLIVPALLDRVTGEIEHELNQTILPASQQVDELHLALAEELMLAGENAAALGPDAMSRLAGAVERRESAWLKLSEAAGRIDRTRSDRIAELSASLEAWAQDSSATGRQAAYTGIAGELETLGAELRQLAADRRESIAGMGRLAAGSMLFLSLLAFTSAVVVTRLNQRVRASALQTTRALRQQRVLLESSGEGVFGMDSQGYCTFVNPAATALLGYAAADVVGRNLHSVIHHSHEDGTPYPESDCPSWRTLTLGVAAESGDEVLWRKDGSTIHAEYIASPIVEHGEIRGAVLTVRDVTERLAAEREKAQLLAREQRARSHAETAEQRAKFLSEASEIFSASLEIERTLESLSRLVVPRIADSCVIYLVDDDGEIQRLQPTHADPERQRLITAQFEKYPPRMEYLIPPVRRALKLGRSSLLRSVSGPDLKARPGDRTHSSVMDEVGLNTLVVAPLRARGRIIGAISFAREAPHYGPRDLTLAEELAGRAALAIDNARLYQGSRAAAAARQEMVAIVSHDLRNPLNVVRMGTQALIRHWPPHNDGEAERRQLAVMQKAAERMNRLVRDLLDLAQIDAGRFAIDSAWVEPRQILSETQELIEPLAAEKDVRVCVETDQDLPRSWGDQERLIQVLSNLGTNAVKFSAPGSAVTLRVSCEPERLVFSVSDSGPGIPPEHVPHIFDRFWQAKHRRDGGVGLGLSIAMGIIESHGGKLWVESAEGVGSTFYFSLPLPQTSNGRPPVPDAAAAY